MYETWRVGKALGRGGFGTAYRGLHVESHAPVAIKVEHPETSQKHKHNSPLQNEICMYKALHPCAGLPRVEWVGALRARAPPRGDDAAGGRKPKSGLVRVLVMQLLGGSLEHARARQPASALPLAAAGRGPPAAPAAARAPARRDSSRY